MADSQKTSTHDAADIKATVYDSDSGGDDGWKDADDDQEMVDLHAQCFFCLAKSANADQWKHHLNSSHAFDFAAKLNALGPIVTIYIYIKFVNYLRLKGQQGEIPVSITAKDLEDDDLLKPVLEDDALLYSYDDLVPLPSQPNTTDDGTPEKILDWETSEFAKRLAALQHESSITIGTSGDFHDSYSHDKGKARVQGDKDYFESYAGNQIHREMLEDTVRTGAYRDFIKRYSDLIKGKTVLDVGCGTGILSLFCAQAGAAKVYAVDNSDIIWKAQKIIQLNGYDNIIDICPCKVEELDGFGIPHGSIDVIVSEWMGYALLFESMLDSVIFARDRYLKPGGLMIPSHAALHIAAISDNKLMMDEKEGFWKNVYGFDMTPMKEPHAFNEHNVGIFDVPRESLASHPSLFKELDLYSITVAELDFTAQFELQVNRWEPPPRDVRRVDGLVTWFDIFMVPPNGIPPLINAERFVPGTHPGWAFTTGPGGEPTHWHSAVLLFKDAYAQDVFIKRNKPLKGAIAFKKLPEKAERELEIRGVWEWGENGECGEQTWVCRT